MRIILVALEVVGFLIFSVPLLGILKLMDKKDPERARRFSLQSVQWIFRLVLWTAGVTYEVRGREHIPTDRAVLYVGNHRSYFDILVGYVTVPGPMGFVAKKEMEQIPLLSTWMRRVSCLFLDRKNIKEGLKTILAGIEQIRGGVSVWIFPEGTRNENPDPGELLEFHEGSLKIAEKSGCPVIPVAIRGTSAVFEDHLPWIRPGHVVITYGEPIELKTLPREQRRFPGSYTRDVIISMLRQDEMKESRNNEEA